MPDSELQTATLWMQPYPLSHLRGKPNQLQNTATGPITKCSTPVLLVEV